MRCVDAPILVFDSGVGGLTILEAIAEALPGAPLVYACDNAAFPYGPKPEDELVDRVHDVLDALVRDFAPRLMVVACNTASTVALPRLRSHYTLPIVGVVPAIKPAARLSKNRVIGLLATPGTVRRPYTDQLIAEFAADCTVVRVGSSELVLAAEQKLRGHAIDAAPLRSLLAPILEAGADTVVLGCTHFPLLRAELELAAARALNWVDSGEAIARRVRDLLPGAYEGASAGGTRAAVFTRDDAEVTALVPALAARGFGAPRFVRVGKR
jgi:glutamate racemase